MSPNSLKYSRGVTLVEVLLSLVVLLIVMLGLMQTALLSIESNTANQMRDEAVSIASTQMSAVKSMAFDALKEQDFKDLESAGDNLASCADEARIPKFPVGDACADRNNVGPYEIRERPVRNMNVRYGVFTCVEPPVPTDTAMIKIVVRYEFRNECFQNSVTTLRRND